MTLRALAMTMAAAAALTVPAAASPKPPTTDSSVGSVTLQANAAHDGHIVFPDGFKPPLKQKWARSFTGARFVYPIVANGLVFTTDQTTNTFYALDLATGKTVWQQHIHESFPAFAAYDNGRIFLVQRSAVIRAFSADRTGTLLWSTQFDSSVIQIDAPPVAAGGHLIIDGEASHDKAVFCLNGETGAIEWQNFVDGGGYGVPTVADNAVFIAHPYQVFKFDLATGNTLWKAYWSGDGGGSRTPVYFKNRLYVRDLTGTSQVTYETRKGKLVGTFGTIYPPAFWTSPSGKPYQIALDDGLYMGLDPDTGNELWSFQGDKFLTTPPLVINDVVFAGSASGLVYALDPRTGKQLWSTMTSFHIPPLDEQGGLMIGMGAGEYTLVVPALSGLTAFVQDVRGQRPK